MMSRKKCKGSKKNNKKISVKRKDQKIPEDFKKYQKIPENSRKFQKRSKTGCIRGHDRNSNYFIFAGSGLMNIPSHAVSLLVFFLGVGGSALIAWGVTRQMLRELRSDVDEIRRLIHPGDGTCNFVTRQDIRDHHGYIFVTHHEFEQWKNEICRKMTGIRDMLKEMDRSREDARKATEARNLTIQRTLSRLETLLEENEKRNKSIDRNG